jgi:hypothetical protein
MQTDNILASTLVAIILGNDRVIEAHSQVCVKTYTNAGCVIMREAIVSRAHRKPSAKIELAAFLEATRARFDRGNRLIFVTGFPKTTEDARDIMAACPNLITFSIQDPNTRHFEANDPRGVLSKGDFYVVDQSRGPGKQMKFMSNTIRNLIVSLAVSKAALKLDTACRLQPAHA